MKKAAVIGFCLTMIACSGHADAAGVGSVRSHVDCDRPGSELASVICSSDELIMLEQEMAASYSHALKAVQATPLLKQALQEKQQHWFQGMGERCIRLKKEVSDIREQQLSCIRTQYRDRLVVLNRPDISRPLTETKVLNMAAYLGDKTCADVSRIGEVENPAALREFSCQYFKVDPKMAANLFGVCREAGQFAPVCDVSPHTDSIAGIGKYLTQLEYMRGDSTCTESVKSSHYRSAKIDELLMLNDDNVDPAALKRLDLFDETQPLNPAAEQIAHWARQGLWEKTQYATLKRLRDAAELGLADFYIKKFGWPEAKAHHVAQYYVIYLADDYLGMTNISFTENLAMRKKDLGDLDAYLHGDAQIQARYKDKLGYFLRLAVVNDYPLDVIRKLLDSGAPVNGGGKGNTDTPLMQAVVRPDVVKLLLERGANVNAQNSFGKTPLMYAIEYNNKDVINLLIMHKPDVALATFETEECGSNGFSLEAGGRTALMYAAWYSKPSIIKELIAYGADVNAKDSEGDTSFEYLDRNTSLSSEERTAAEVMLGR